MGVNKPMLGLMVLFCITLWGCASDDGSEAAEGSVAQNTSSRTSELDAGTVDPVGSVTNDASTAGPTDDASARTATSDGTSQGSGPDGQEDDTSDEPVSGQFGAPCDENLDCYSHFCVESYEGGVCSKTCESECPEGWSC